MAKQVRRYIKTLIKIAIWIIVGFILFFVVVATLIQHPVIQTSILHRITSAVSDKTKTTVEIENIRISFPKSVVVRGVYLDDLQQDTLLYAGSIKVNLALKDLLFSKINVNSVTLEDVSVNMTRSRTDTLFNYYFLIAAFTDTARVPKAEPVEPSPWSFSIDRLSLDHTRFRFDDGYGGLDVAVALQKLRLKMDELDLEGAVYSIDALAIEGLQANVSTNKAGRSAGEVVQADGGAGQPTAQADPLSGQLAEQTPPPSHPSSRQ
ncbi:MAG: AsmA family protein, partial [Bacteroidales bacterium]|nr:AsmA family protein [Bacteroidales bacterium]